jgi:hypothetical protein
MDLLARFLPLAFFVEGAEGPGFLGSPSVSVSEPDEDDNSVEEVT